MSSVSVITSHDDGSVLTTEYPWPGLSAYTETDSAWFFGRDQETEELLWCVCNERLTVLFGQSGLGKTSLLQAGLFPRLREKNYIPIYIRLDFTDQTTPLTEQVASAIAHTIKTESIDAPYPEPGNGFFSYLQTPTLEWWSQKLRLLSPVLVFDQFEEIFTLGRYDEARNKQSTAFLHELADLIESRGGKFKIVLSFREDYLSEFEELKRRIHSLFLNRVRITRFSGESAQLVLKQSGSHLFAAGVIDQIVRYVAADETNRPLKELSVEPALLSVLCQALNNKRRQLKAVKITTDLLAGDHHTILRNLVTDAFAPHSKALAEGVEEYLLTDGGYRTQFPWEDFLRRTGISKTAVSELVTKRILRAEVRGDVTWLELTHDVLAPVIKENRDRRRLISERIKLEIRRRRQLRFAAIALSILMVLIVIMFIQYREAKVLQEAAELARLKAENALTQAHKASARLLKYSGIVFLDQKKYNHATAAFWEATHLDPINYYTGFSPPAQTIPNLISARSVNTETIGAVVFHPEGQRFFTSHYDGNIYEWHVAHEQPIRKIAVETPKTKNSTVRTLAMISTEYIVAGNYDGEIVLIDIATWQIVWRSDEMHTDEYKPFRIIKIHTNGNQVFVGHAGSDTKEESWGGKITLWKVDLEKQRLFYQKSYQMASGSVHCITTTPDLDYLFATSGRGLVQLWHLEDGREIFRSFQSQGTHRSWGCTYDHKNDRMVSAAVYPRGSAAQSSVSELFFWHFRQQAPNTCSADNNFSVTEFCINNAFIDRKIPFPYPVTNVHFTPDGSILTGGNAYLGFYANGHLQWQIPVSIRRMAAQDPSSASTPWVTVGDGGIVKLWTIPVIEQTPRQFVSPILLRSEASVNRLEWSATDNTLLATDVDGYLTFWDIASGYIIHRKKIFNQSIMASDWNKQIVFRDPTAQRMMLYDRFTGQIQSVSGTKQIVALSNRHLIAGDHLFFITEQNTSGGTGNIAKVNSQGEVLYFEGHARDVNAMAITPDESVLITGGHEREVIIWDAKTAQILQRWKFDNSIRSIDINIHGLVAIAFDSTVVLRTLEANNTLYHLHGHTALVRRVIFSPDGTLLATAGNDHKIFLWSSLSGEILRILHGHQDNINDLLFSDDGKTLYSASHDGSIRAWQVDALIKHENECRWPAFTGVVIDESYDIRRLRRVDLQAFQTARNAAQQGTQSECLYPYSLGQQETE